MPRPDRTAADPAGDQAALHRLAEWCLRYAPLVAPDPPDGLWIDITGSTHLHGGEAALLRDLVHRLTSQGPAARAAIADTPGMAHADARYASVGFNARYADAGFAAREAGSGFEARPARYPGGVQGVRPCRDCFEGRGRSRAVFVKPERSAA